MPRRPVDEITVSTLNKAVRDIEEGKSKPRLIRVGGVSGLGLNVRLRSYASGESMSASWLLRRTVEGKRRDFALGGWPEVTLAQARERARQTLDQLWAGIDPLEARRNKVKPRSRTFREAARNHFEQKVSKEINVRDKAKWFNDLEKFAFPVIGDLPVDKIVTSHILEITRRPHVRYGSTVAKPLWEAVPERAQRCIKKIELILNREISEGGLSGANPARWKDHLSGMLPKPEKVRRKENQPSLPYPLLPAFMASLRTRNPSPSSKALEFLILTAARSGEVRGATWSEIDMERGLWTIPAERMKAKKDHRVPLSEAALSVLKATPCYALSSFIWPGSGKGGVISDTSLAALIKKMHANELASGRAGWVDLASGRTVTPHGFRSTFRVWATEQTTFPYEMAEMALAHRVGTAVERAYNRTDMVEKRRAMMEDWAAHVLNTVDVGLRAVG